MKTEACHPHIRKLLVAEAMHEGVFACEREAPLSEVAATMARERVHCVVVDSGSGEGAPPWGIVSDLDLVAAALVRDLDDQSAGGSAGTPVVMVTPDETLQRAAQLMTSTTQRIWSSSTRRAAAARRPLDARHRSQPLRRAAHEDTHSHHRYHRSEMATARAAIARPPAFGRLAGHYLPDLVYGANDGIITTFAVVSGVVGASLSERVIVILGLANLVADGFSMGASNYRRDARSPRRISQTAVMRFATASQRFWGSSSRASFRSLHTCCR